VDKYQTTRTYHPNDTSTGDQIVSNIAHSFATTMGSPEGTSIFGMVQEEIEQEWVSTRDWINSDHVTYYYNPQNKVVELLEQSWNNEWVDSYQETMTYDANNNLLTKMDQSWNGTGWDNEELSHYTWGQYTGTDDDVSPAASGLQLTAYPNPSKSDVLIKVGSRKTEPIHVSIYNLKGQKVADWQVLPGQALNWDGKTLNNQSVGAGIYYLKAHQGSAAATRKIIRLN